MKHKELVKKYDGKTIRIEKWVYRIEVISNSGETTVYLHPTTPGDVADSNFDTSSYGYTHGGKTFCIAVDKAKEIKNEIVAAFETDF